MTNTLPGHEHCLYVDNTTPELNSDLNRIDRFIAFMSDRIIDTAPELEQVVADHGAESDAVAAYARIVLGAIQEVEGVSEARDCVMNEIMNRAYAENAQR